MAKAKKCEKLGGDWAVVKWSVFEQRKTWLYSATY
jgi:hypothetical protein